MPASLAIQPADEVRQRGALGQRLRLRSFPAPRYGVIGAFMFLAVLAVVGTAAPLVAPHDPNEASLALRLVPPVWSDGGSWTYPLGTDALGRDMLSRVIYGARISVLIGLASVAAGGCVGVVLGLVSGFYGGRIGAIIMRLADIQLAFPFILLALSVMAALGPGLINLIVVLAIGQWVDYARIVRGEVLSIRERAFVEAARAVGQREPAIIGRQILPNIVGPVIVIASLSIGTVILAEASLTFLGAGVEAGIPTWGSMIADGRDYMNVGKWIATVPGVVLMLTILSINLVGDWLRDALDPRLGRT